MPDPAATALATIESEPAMSADEVVPDTISVDEAVASIPGIYASLRTPLMLAISGSTRDIEIAEDLTQEAFIRLVTEARAGRMPRKPEAWLHRVGYNLAMTHARKASTMRRLQPRLIAPVGGDSSPERQVLDREWAEGCADALAAVSPITRQVLIMAAAGMPRSEIARLVGRSEGATRTLLCRGRARLRDLGVESVAAADR